MTFKNREYINYSTFVKQYHNKISLLLIGGRCLHRYAYISKVVVIENDYTYHVRANRTSYFICTGGHAKEVYFHTRLSGPHSALAFSPGKLFFLL